MERAKPIGRDFREGFSRLTDGAALEKARLYRETAMSGRGGTGRRWRLKIRSKIHMFSDLAPGEGPPRGGPKRFSARWWITHAPSEVPRSDRFDDLDTALAEGERLWKSGKTTRVQILIDDEEVVWEQQRG